MLHCSFLGCRSCHFTVERGLSHLVAFLPQLQCLMHTPFLRPPCARAAGVSSVLCRFATSLPQLLCLRALYGVAVGVSMHSSPPYLAETCPAPVRGLVFCAKEGMIVAGILKGYMVRPWEQHEVWRNKCGHA